MFCKKCGAQIEEGAQFCSGCGQKITGEDSIEGSGKKPRGLGRTQIIILGVLIVVIVVAAIFLTVAKVRSSNSKSSRTESFREDDDREDKKKRDREEEDEKRENEEEKVEEETDEENVDTTDSAANEALADLIKEIENEYTYLYAIEDFDGDGIYEMLCKPADLSFEMGRYAYDGSEYQLYGTSDEEWNYYSQEEGLEFYPYREMLAYLEMRIPLPGKPQWLVEYAEWIENRVWEPVRVSLVSIDDDEIPECVLWVDWYGTGDSAEGIVLSWDGDGVTEYYNGDYAVRFWYRKRSGKFVFLTNVDGYEIDQETGEAIWEKWNMVELSNHDFFIRERAHSSYDYRFFIDYETGDQWEVDSDTFDEYLNTIDEYFYTYIGGDDDIVINFEDGIWTDYNYMEALEGAYGLWSLR